MIRYLYQYQRQQIALRHSYKQQQGRQMQQQKQPKDIAPMAAARAKAIFLMSTSQVFETKSHFSKNPQSSLVGSQRSFKPSKSSYSLGMERPRNLNET